MWPAAKGQPAIPFWHHLPVQESRTAINSPATQQPPLIIVTRGQRHLLLPDDNGSGDETLVRKRLLTERSIERYTLYQLHQPRPTTSAGNRDCCPDSLRRLYHIKIGRAEHRKHHRFASAGAWLPHAKIALGDGGGLSRRRLRPPDTTTLPTMNTRAATRRAAQDGPPISTESPVNGTTKAPAASQQAPEPETDENIFLFVPNLIGMARSNPPPLGRGDGS